MKEIKYKSFNLVSSYYQLGNCYLLKYDYDSAFKYLQNALSIQQNQNENDLDTAKNL